MLGAAQPARMWQQPPHRHQRKLRPLIAHLRPGPHEKTPHVPPSLPPAYRHNTPLPTAGIPAPVAPDAQHYFLPLTRLYETAQGNIERHPASAGLSSQYSQAMLSALEIWSSNIYLWTDPCSPFSNLL